MRALNPKRLFYGNLFSRILSVALPKEIYILYALSSIGTLRSNKSANKSILVINRPIFSQDVDALADKVENLNIFSIRTGILAALFSRYLPREILGQKYYRTSLQEHEPSWTFVASLAKTFLKKAKKIKNIDMVLTCNVDYWQDYPIALACNDLSVVFAALLKEASLCQADVDLVAKDRKYFYGDAIYFYNKNHKFAVLSGDNINIEDELLMVVGCPRMDRLRSHIRSKKNGSNWVFFSALNYRYIDNKEDYLFTLEVLIEEFNNSKPDNANSLVIKCKSEGDARRHAAALNITPREARKHLDYKSSQTHVLEQASLVFGYGTTAILEALYFPCVIVILRFLSAPDNRDKYSFFGFDELEASDPTVIFLDDISQYNEAVCQFGSNNRPLNINWSARQRVLELHFGYNENISSSGRLERAIISSIEKA